MKMLKIRWTFLEGILGTSTANPDIYYDYLASKAPTEEAAMEEGSVIAGLSVDDNFAKAMTIFPKMEDGTPYQYDYQVKGYFKDSCGMLNRLSGKDPTTGKKSKSSNESGKIKAYKKIIDGNIFVFPRRIPIVSEEPITICQRSLRAATAQGERISLAASEEIAAGATMTFWVLSMSDEYVPAIKEWLDYGILRGTGQWRNSGKGRFTYEILEELEVDSAAEAVKIGQG